MFCVFFVEYTLDCRDKYKYLKPLLAKWSRYYFTSLGGALTGGHRCVKKSRPRAAEYPRSFLLPLSAVLQVHRAPGIPPRDHATLLLARPADQLIFGMILGLFGLFGLLWGTLWCFHAFFPLWSSAACEGRALLLLLNRCSSTRISRGSI